MAKETKKTSEVKNFPYKDSTTTFILVNEDGTIEWDNRITGKREIIKEAKENKTTKLYAVWTGNYRSDVFIIDNLNTVEKEV